MRGTLMVFCGSLALAACAVTADQMMASEPYRTFSSARPHAEIGQCIASSIPATSVIPGPTRTIVNMQGDGPVDVTWLIEPVATGSKITVWRRNSLIWGIGKAEACY